MTTSMCMVKKHAIRPPPSAVATISTNAFFLLDTHTGLRFLIHTGTCRSLLPKSKIHSSCIASTNTNLIAANVSWILTYGYKTLQLSFTGSKYKWGFIVDMANHRLVNASTLASTFIATAPADLALQITDTSGAYSSLKSSYPEVFRPMLHLTP